MPTRRSGLLLHITSLPSRYGIGDFGPNAYRFADFLAAGGQAVWQVLPLGPTLTIGGNSPYFSYSAFAGNPLLISPDLLLANGYLDPSDILQLPGFAEEHVDFQGVSQYKYQLLAKAFQRFKNRAHVNGEFTRFCQKNSNWLNDYALFCSLKEHFRGVSWIEWPRELRDFQQAAVGEWRERLEDEILAAKFFQFLFSEQWSALKHYCNQKNIQILGDIPIYVSLDSVDVWADSEIFKLNEQKEPVFVAGVPPDYFSATGQLWGNPVYNWDRLREQRYAWWIKRVERNLELFDVVRLDHFRGFVGYWEVPARETTAVNGKWVEAPAEDFFNSLLRRFSYLPMVAEDLGTITPDVREIMTTYGFPGMKLLLFAFGDNPATNPYVPHNHVRHCIVYTGTHDNNTVKGWFRKEAREEDKERLYRYLGRKVEADTVHWEFVRLAMMSVADTVILPMQDVLGLDESARMNVPAQVTGNWEWRVKEEYLTAEMSQRLRLLTDTYGRSG